MRATLLLTALLSILLSACASKGEPPLNKHISQSGPLKVHPGLLGQPVPPELQQDQAEQAPPGQPVAQPLVQPAPVPAA